MVFKWKEDHSSIFLSFLVNHEALWNSKCKAYKNKNKRYQALENMVKELNFQGLTVEDIKTKIKTIRTKYASELSKVLKSENGTDEIYVPKLNWYKQADSFLRNVCVPRTTKSAPVPSCKYEDEEFDRLEETEMVTVESFDNNDIESEQISQASVIDFLELLPKSRNKNGNKTALPTRKRSISNLDSINKVINKLSKISEQNRQIEENEFDYFGKSVAVQLKKMPLDRALICQKKLQEVITEERIYQFQLRKRFTPSSCSSGSTVD